MFEFGASLNKSVTCDKKRHRFLGAILGPPTDMIINLIEDDDEFFY